MGRARRTRDDLRRLLVESALVEFGAKGFEAASTRAIAQRADAHQPQINYHFESKEALWFAAVDHLFGQLATAIGVLPDVDDDIDPLELAGVAAQAIRNFVCFAATHPELNRIMIHEATVESDRLRWLLDTHVRPYYEAIRSIWERLAREGIAAPISPASAHYVIVGAGSLPFVNAPEARILMGVEPMEGSWMEAHADGLIAMLLPGLGPVQDRDLSAATSGY